ncbi:MAG TPA: hypothetical protein VFQ78_11455 [Candidatus Udaeobacter sp.]|jgi:predicted RNase H-like nuclease (RuvC/YqgF family)|nr:hypothetical protein [Candidatus Udaeobacter sp.]
MKLKKLKKKIQQLEKRLREGPTKLAKLKRKLQQAETAKALKAARRSAAGATANRNDAGVSVFGQKSSIKRARKKLNLSPERRAQLSEAMKARWAAKRAAAANNTSSTNQNSLPPPHAAPENTIEGI